MSVNKGKKQHQESIREIVNKLRASFKDKEIDKTLIDDYIKKLESIEIYDEKKYPALPYQRFMGTDYPLTRNADNLPEVSNLAEAFIWKQGDWTKYVDFVDYHRNNSKTKHQSTIVHYAFAKHLQNPQDNPIFDQHVFRALVTLYYDDIPETLNLKQMKEVEQYLSCLFQSRNLKWKQSLTGNNVEECYTFYIEQVRKIRDENLKKDFNLRHLDKLLMPLGKAIKTNFTTYAEYRMLFLKIE